MGAYKQKPPTHLGHLRVLESDAAVNEIYELTNLLVAIHLGKDPKEKQRAVQFTNMLRSPFVSGEVFRKVWEEHMAAELRRGLSLGVNRTFPDFMFEESKEERTSNGRILKALAWNLKPGATEATEAVFRTHPRTVVSSEEMKDGNVRAMVKLVSDFGGGKTVSGSGTLISNQVILTTAHNFFDRMWDKSPAQSITVIAGVNGKSVDIETRKGRYAVLSIPWFTNRVSKQDMGLILLDRPFKTANPMKIRQTPASEEGTVYGYSSDAPYNGLVLCKSDSVMTYDKDNTAGMVEHYASTYKGNSGGGVVGGDKTLFAIHQGHVEMIDGTVINRAVAVNREGNDIVPFVSVLDHMAKQHDRNKDYLFRDVDFAVKEGAGAEVEMVKEVKGANGFSGRAYTWRDGDWLGLKVC